VLRISSPSESVYCEIDTNLIKQAMLNILINAVQAMDSGGELLMKLTATDETAVLDIIDTGPGIAPDRLGVIFQPYFSTKSNGSGLGLSTARRILREHGGSIHVESEPGKGTRFILKLARIDGKASG